MISRFFALLIFMKFTKFEIYHLQLRLKKPFETSFARFQDKDTVFVKAYTKDGLVGLGEAPALPFPFYNYECTDTVISMLSRFILPPLLNEEINSIDELEKSYSLVRGHNMAKTGIEAAFWHIKAQEEQKPLWQLWGGVRKEIEAGISLGVEQDVSGVLTKVEKALEAGYKRIKIKIKPGMDIKVAKAVREKFGDISLMLDANSAYTLADTDTLKKLDEYKLLMLEQPLGHDDIIDHADLQKELQTPVCLDESIHSLEDAQKAIRIGATKIINIKPPRVGGFWQSKLMAEYCESKNIPVWCGGMIETGWGKAFNVHISTLNNFSLAGDTSGTAQYFEEDVIEPDLIVDKNSMIQVPTTPGVGFEIKEKTFKKLTRNIIEIREE